MFLFPLLLPLGPAHPLSILLNSFFSVPLFWLVLPTSLMGFLFPPIQKKLEPFFEAVFSFLEKISFLIPESYEGFWLSLFWSWVYVFLIYVGLFIRSLREDV